MLCTRPRVERAGGRSAGVLKTQLSNCSARRPKQLQRQRQQPRREGGVSPVSSASKAMLKISGQPSPRLLQRSPKGYTAVRSMYYRSSAALDPSDPPLSTCYEMIFLLYRRCWLQEVGRQRRIQLYVCVCFVDLREAYLYDSSVERENAAGGVLP